MKRLIWLMLILTLVACGPSGIVTPTVTPSPSSTLVMVTATGTSSLTLTPSATYTSVPATPTIVPTLPVDDARQLLLDLLSNNGNCRLPCLWGIVPGESTFWDARAILASLSGLSGYSHLNFPGPDSISPTYNENGVEIYTRVTFLINPESKITNQIAYSLEAHRSLQKGGYEIVYDSKFFGNKTSAYGLPHVLSEQGIPSSVMIATWGGPLTRGFTGGFDILLLYPDKGILVNYNTQMYVVGANVRGCPANAQVEMELYPPGQRETFFEFLKETDWNVKLNDYRPLEEVTSMTLDEFYETFRDDNSKCVETPTSYWRMPEE
jgi:hypothetical protein